MRILRDKKPTAGCDTTLVRLEGVTTKQSNPLFHRFLLSFSRALLEFARPIIIDDADLSAILSRSVSVLFFCKRDALGGIFSSMLLE